ncbi:ThiF family adenylyltransferase, partial [Streptomyces sp. T-3]|nr:ThiF family adenylyltransferase [Streptomyces sp. T-3]
DLALATAVAGLAAGHALAFLDGAFPAAVGTRWEAPLPGLDWRSERVRPHPDCFCGAAARDEREDTSREGESHETMAG